MVGLKYDKYYINCRKFKVWILKQFDIITKTAIKKIVNLGQ